MSKVALVRCESYEYAEVKTAVQKGLDLLGGAGKFAKLGEKILFKVNLLIGEAPEKCATTHPTILKAAAEIFKTTGAGLSYGDSPAFGSTHSAAKKSGMVDIAEETGIELKDFQTGSEVQFADGVQNKKFTIANAVLESDGVISLPKLKTHGFEKFTGAVKNQFGCIPGLLKGEFHVRVPDALQFAKMLVDLDRRVHPRLYIMDGVYAMEGNGPRGGTPKKMNVLLFSEDPIALDATACRIINLDPALVPTIIAGRDAGRGVFAIDGIELVGDDLASFISKDFDVDRAPVKPYREKGIFKFISNRLVARPVIDKNKCIKCGICINVCPTVPKSVDWRPGSGHSAPPAHNYRTCIRCYCCQELCPEKAIDLKKPLLRRMFGKKKR
jgi:uncharacterized protein (DUF362 family)/NAD-dependent dihydropyrimidine dehydrogenase PreA subunit